MTRILNYQRYWGICAVACAALLVACASTPMPNEQMAVSKAAITNAANAGAAEFAAVELRTAQEKLDSANKAMIAKDYSRALVLAEQAEVDAQLAATRARAAKAQKAAGTTQEQNRVLQQELDRKNK